MKLSNRTYNLFDEFFKDPFFSRPLEEANTHLMKTDIKEKGDNYQVEIELPGYKKEDIQAELKDGYLVITANHTESKEEKDEDGKYLCRERFSGTCKRNFYVGEHVKQEDIQAEFADGVLKLELPKNAPEAIEEQSKLIEIQ